MSIFFEFLENIERNCATNVHATTYLWHQRGNSLETMQDNEYAPTHAGQPDKKQNSPKTQLWRHRSESDLCGSGENIVLNDLRSQKHI